MSPQGLIRNTNVLTIVSNFIDKQNLKSAQHVVRCIDVLTIAVSTASPISLQGVRAGGGRAALRLTQRCPLVTHTNSACVQLPHITLKVLASIHLYATRRYVYRCGRCGV